LDIYNFDLILLLSVFLQDIDVLKLNSYWFEKDFKSWCYHERISNATNGHMSRFLKAAANSMIKSVKFFHISGFQKSLHVAANGFRKITAQATFCNIGRISESFHKST
jgi:hypothetical protein